MTTMTRREFVWSGAAFALGAATSGARAWAALPAAAPDEVLIMRSGEEPEGTDIHLNDAGKARAKALAQWIPATYGKPAFLFASHPTGQSRRAVETLEPLAAALRLKIQDQFANDEFAKLAARLLKEPEYAGKRILVCWTRSNIPKLASALGAKNPPDWPATQYDHIWRLKFGSAGVTLEDAVQMPPRGK